MKTIETRDGIIPFDTIRGVYITRDNSADRPVFAIKFICEFVSAEYPTIDKAEHYLTDLAHKLNAKEILSE